LSQRDVIDSLMHKKKAPRVGLVDYPWPDTLKKWTLQGYTTELKVNDDGVEEELPVPPTDHFDYDLICVGGWFDIFPLRGHSEIIEETDEWEIRRNGSGAALKYWKHKSGTPEHVDFTMTSRKIWDEKYRSHLLEVDKKRIDIETCRTELEKRRQQGKWTHFSHLFIWEHMRQSMGDVCMYETLLLDKPWIHDFCRVYTDFFKAHFKLLFEEAGLPDGVRLCEDLGYKNGLFCSPGLLEELIIPYYKEIVDFFHSCGLVVMLHSCGLVEEALPLIVEAGFDALDPMERKAGCDPIRFAEKYGDKLTLIGGLDERVFESGDRSLIKKEVTKLVTDMKSAGASYIFASDHSISTNVELTDYEYALEVYKENMIY